MQGLRFRQHGQLGGTSINACNIIITNIDIIHMSNIYIITIVYWGYIGVI